MEGLRRQSLKLVTCPMCKGKWLGSPSGSRYCQRIAPDQSRDCRTLAKEKRQAGDRVYAAYRREYKRIQEAHRRGKVDTLDLLAWRKENGPASWAPFQSWAATRKEEGTKHG
jgi:Zn-finger nucleic acid-binding protein